MPKKERSRADQAVRGQAIRTTVLPRHLSERAVLPVKGVSDEGRIIVRNEDGSGSSERTIGVQAEGLNMGYETNIPTMFGGQSVSPGEAIRRVRKAGGRDPDTHRVLPGYRSVEEAEAAAAKRTRELGKHRRKKR